MRKHLTYYILLSLFLISCSSNYTPKPPAYFRIDFPPKQYTEFDTAFPYKFEYPEYANIVEDKEGISEPYWINVEFPKYKAKIHISYKKMSENTYEYYEDARTLAYKHIIKADAIQTKVFVDEKRKVYGTMYEISGNAASAVQFFVTDSITNFLRGALYFSCKPNIDSLAPAIQYFKTDVIHLIETLEWKHTDNKAL